MNGLVFEDLASVVPTAPNRADVACFVGFVGRRSTSEGSSVQVVPPPDATGATSVAWPLYAWLNEAGWATRPFTLERRTLLESLLDVPVPLESWEAFDRLFDWDKRLLLRRNCLEQDSTALYGTTYLGAAVRSFFEQGGRRCYVVRVGDPWPLDASESERQQGLCRLIPGFPNGFEGSSVERTTWRGVGHLFGLPDVSFLCLPDLADAVSAERPFPKAAPEWSAMEEAFVECSTEMQETESDRLVRAIAAPRCKQQGYSTWAAALRCLGKLLQDPTNGLREVQLVASIPLPAYGTGESCPERDLLGWLKSNQWLDGVLDGAGSAPASFASAFVQLAWPWIKTLGSRELPEELEGPDAVLVGVLARNALVRGAYCSAAGLSLAGVHEVFPLLQGKDCELGNVGESLIQRVSLLGPTPGGLRVLSDVTTFPGEAYRQANVNRLVSAIVRAARRLGEDFAFEVSGSELWSGIRRSLNSLMAQLWSDGALHGRTASEAFDVRCDQSLMSQHDIDQGRVLVEIRFEPAMAIEQVRIVLALARGNVSVVRAA